MWQTLAILEECTVMMLCIHCFWGKWQKTPMKYVGLLLFAAQTAATTIWGFGISVWGQVLLFAAAFKCLYWKEKWYRVLEMTVIAYGGFLMYLQIFVILWIPTEWFEIFGYFGVAFGLNMVALLLCLGVCFVIRRLKMTSMTSWFRWVGLASALLMMVAAQRYRVEIMETYRVQSKIFSLILIIIIGVLFLMKLWEDKKKLEGLKAQLNEKERMQHDYLKQLDYVQTMGKSALVDELRLDEKQQALYDNIGWNIASVLFHYTEKGKELDIDVQIESSAAVPTWNISEKDALTIFGNLIENAFHAVQDLDRERRWVKISFLENGQRIVLWNPYEESAEKPVRKGYGLDLIRAAVKKNRGTMEQYQEDRCYITVLHF